MPKSRSVTKPANVGQASVLRQKRTGEILGRLLSSNGEDAQIKLSLLADQLIHAPLEASTLSLIPRNKKSSMVDFSDAHSGILPKQAKQAIKKILAYGDPLISEQLRLMFTKDDKSRDVHILSLHAMSGDVGRFVKQAEEAREENPFDVLFLTRVLQATKKLNSKERQSVHRLYVSLIEQISENGKKYLLTEAEEIFQKSDADVFFIYCFEGAVYDGANYQNESMPFVVAQEKLLRQGVKPSVNIGVTSLEFLTEGEAMQKMLPVWNAHDLARFLNVVMESAGQEDRARIVPRGFAP